MRGVDTAYEVRIFVPNDADDSVAKHKMSFKYSARTFGIRAQNQERAETQAEKIAKKHNGHVASVRKAEIETIYETDNIRLLEPLVPKPEMVKNSPYESAIAMDELIWKKRNIRREQAEKEKKEIDNT